MARCQEFSILHHHRAPFVISKGHILRRWLGIDSFQVRPHQRRPRGGHPLRLFQGEISHLLFQGESARLRHQGGHPTAVLFQRGRSPSATTWSASRVRALPMGTSPSVTSEETHDLFISVVHNVMLYMCYYLLCSIFHQSSFKHTDRNAYICLLLSLL